MKLKSLLFFLAGIIFCCFTPQKNKVVQIDISKLLNGRPVTTLTDGKLITWTIGIDGDGTGDGFLTHSAAEFNGDINAHALPDNPVYPANAQHPEIVLHYNNADSVHSQTANLAGEGEFLIKVPKDHYSAIYLGLTSAQGATALQFELKYANGIETKDYLLPDWYDSVSDKTPNLSYVVSDLAKWAKKNKMPGNEKSHHNIHLLKLDIDPARKLTAIKLVKKTKESYLLLWSATGVTK
jgi:hypothetical protein